MAVRGERGERGESRGEELQNACCWFVCIKQSSPDKSRGAGAVDGGDEALCLCSLFTLEELIPNCAPFTFGSMLDILGLRRGGDGGLGAFSIACFVNGFCNSTGPTHMNTHICVCMYIYVCMYVFVCVHA